jgi:hypothetical protein
MNIPSSQALMFPVAQTNKYDEERRKLNPENWMLAQ